MQLCMEIHVVTLHKVVETMPQLMRSAIKAKGGHITGCNFFVVDCNIRVQERFFL